MIKNMNFNDARFELGSHKECIKRSEWPDDEFLYEQENYYTPGNVLESVIHIPDSAAFT